MPYIKVLETYAIRWNIEIGLKETMQLLGLTKCPANDFYSHIAHVTAVFAAHAMLIWLKFTEVHSPLGVLFEDIQQHTTMLTMEKLLLMLEAVLASIAETLGGAENITFHSCYINLITRHLSK